jgi:hypothetical protein
VWRSPIFWTGLVLGAALAVAGIWIVALIWSAVASV